MDSGTNRAAITTQRHRRRRACHGVAGDVARSSRSHPSGNSDGSDHPPDHPKIHPRSTVDRRMRRVSATSNSEKLPISRKRLGDLESCRIVGPFTILTGFRGQSASGVRGIMKPDRRALDLNRLLTLLELIAVNLHDAVPGRWALKVRSVWLHAETGRRRSARSAGRQRQFQHLGSRRGCDRRGRHGRRRRLHQPRISGQGHPIGFFPPVAVDHRRHRRAVRGVFLRRARRHVSALERRVQLPRPRLSPGRRLRGGLGLGDRRLRRARCRSPRWRSASTANRCCRTPRRWRSRSAWCGWCRW